MVRMVPMPHRMIPKQKVLAVVLVMHRHLSFSVRMIFIFRIFIFNYCKFGLVAMDFH